MNANQRCLAAAVALATAHVRRAAGETCAIEPLVAEVDAAHDEAGGDSVLDTLAAAFGLGPFECGVLALAVGVEVDAACARAVSQALGDPPRSHPTIALCISAFPGAYLAAFAPSAPLRRWRLVELGGGGTFAENTLRVDETLLHQLLGARADEPRLAACVRPVLAESPIATPLSALEDDVLVVLPGPADRARAWAATARVPVLELDPRLLPTRPDERELLLDLAEREGRRRRVAWLCDGKALAATFPDEGEAMVRRLVGPVFLLAERAPTWIGRRARVVRVSPPTVEQARTLWADALGPLVSDPDDLSGLAAQFPVTPALVRDVAAEVADAVRDTGVRPADAAWDACRRRLSPRLDELAMSLEPRARWDDLVLPPEPMRLLRELADQARHRHVVHEEWGFGGVGARGLGIAALFAGPSGTGKTLAAEVIASELRLDLLRIDLSRVVSKYIGDTERNLSRVFDAAESGGAVLVFDEADALFGKRTETRDAHDRYANIEVSYLLQRMETYRGIAVLTTNHRDALDTAFSRRLRFVVRFPHPEPAQRLEIWRRVFPERVPLEAVDLGRLARLDVTGGNIRNMALHAAFLAAAERGPVRMPHLLRAAQVELAKTDRVLTGADTRGWA